MNSKNIIVIPVYKSTISSDESASLKQCLAVLKRHDIALVCPEHLDISEYDIIFKQYGVHEIIVRFDDSYFTSLNSYSRLCLTDAFYRRFANYQYMLIYQLDCWVFCDKLQYWCDMGYDYIGAPWSDEHLVSIRLQKHPVGNGGLSLRKIETMIKLTSYPIHNQSVRLHRTFKKFLTKQKKKKRLISNILTFPVIVIKYLVHGHKRFTKNEDVIIAVYAQKYIPTFTIPDALTAARFSIEDAPSFFCNKIGGLPFGTHAWNKYGNDTFWKQFITV